MATLHAAGLDPLCRSLGRYMRLSEDDRAALSALDTGPQHEVEARSVIACEGENANVIRLLISGWACRYKNLPDGRRQILGFILPGDFCDLNIYFPRRLDHSICALTTVRFYEIEPALFRELIDRRPHFIQAALWHEMACSGTQREWLLSLGRRSPIERLSHLFVELYYRQRAAGLATGLSFDLPITQNHLAEANGLSFVHLNRTLQEMRREGLIELSGRRLGILDLDRLKDVAMFSRNFHRDLQLDQEV